MEEDEGEDDSRLTSAAANRPIVSTEPSIMEEDEEDDHDTSRGTVIKEETGDE
jgi:condensin complex subunit 3